MKKDGGFMFDNLKKLGLVCLICTLNLSCLKAQESYWDRVLPLDVWKDIDQSDLINLRNYKLMVEVQNAINDLESTIDGGAFLSESERIAFDAIRREFALPQFQFSFDRSQGKPSDGDKMFMEMNRLAERLLPITAVALGDKFSVVLNVVNQRSVKDWAGGDPTHLTNQKLASVLELDDSQMANIARLVSECEAEISKSTSDLSDVVRKARLAIRQKMVVQLDSSGRAYFERVFGEPVDLINANGNSVFIDICKHYDGLPESDLVETVQTIIRPAPHSNTGWDFLDRIKKIGTDLAEPQTATIKTIKLDYLEYTLIQSNAFIDELSLTEKQRVELQKALTGEDVVVEKTTTERNVRMVRLLEEVEIEDSVITRYLSENQKARMAQIELQVRTIEHVASFGMLDPIVAMKLELEPKIRQVIAKLAEDGKQEIERLISIQRDAQASRLAELSTDLFDELNDTQRDKYERYLGLPKSVSNR
jgi:hypothetical protein